MSVSQEASLTFFSLLMGSAFALLFDLSTLFGRKIRRFFLQNVLDIALWLACAYVFAYGMFLLGSGRVRMATFGFLLLGAFLYFRLFRKPLLGIIRHLARTVYRWFLRPLWIIFSFLFFPLFYLLRHLVTIILSLIQTLLLGRIHIFGRLWGLIWQHRRKFCFWCQKGG
ncbi:MAG: spore cortex biosynthesis protein YabQ [Candidatus Carbobacillus altaicus]|uniref:Spore cortex biosynthesis protein n=1 Tax=Candidatus Carbonibacillus altaicus TaxID=2163959 RepID=A0A2R6Y1M1_9BACL|nr:spore cortex biosynthesis protein YabQ [Candidatus Carbobacillus altaicus]PTQ56570.1 MAG: hypothetical protein BSOLF_0017 [Candidatus Carbobacillus altaicus]